MYPSEDDPGYGVFVKNFETLMNAAGQLEFSKKIVLTKKHSKVGKLLGYLGFYWSIFMSLFFGKRQYDLVYVHFPLYAAPVLALFPNYIQQHLVLNFHGSDAEINSGLKRFLDKYQKKIVSLCRLVVVPSSSFGATVQSLYPGIQDKLYAYPSGGINSGVFYPKEKLPAKEILKIGTDDTVIGFVSNLIPEKGWRSYVMAMKEICRKHDNVKGIMVGHGPDWQACADLLAHNGLEGRISMFPKVGHDQLNELYNAMDLFVFPSQRTVSESLGLVGLEAMACRVPVIGANVGGIMSYLQDGKNGFLFDHRSVDELTFKLDSFLALGDSEKERMSAAALTTAQHYDSKLVSQQLLTRLISLI